MMLLLAAAPPVSRFFDTRTAPGYGDPRPALKRYLERAQASSGAQHVCVVGYRVGKRERQAWVHWREGHRLVLWDGGDPDHRGSLIGWGRRDLDLRRDVVASEAALGGSSFLVTRRWANTVATECANHGVRYVLHRR